MQTFTANEAKTRFGEFLDRAQREPVGVLRHDRRVGVMANAQDFAFGIPVFSETTFAKLETRIWKPRFDRYLSMPASHGILHDARAVGLWASISDDTAAQRFSRDADDDKFLHAASTKVKSPRAKTKNHQNPDACGRRWPAQRPAR